MLRQREKLLLVNQKYWGTFRRKEWLVNGDGNSRYFQQQANTRRKKKLVCKLKDDCGMWVDNLILSLRNLFMLIGTDFCQMDNGALLCLTHNYALGYQTQIIST